MKNEKCIKKLLSKNSANLRKRNIKNYTGRSNSRIVYILSIHRFIGVYKSNIYHF